MSLIKEIKSEREKIRKGPDQKNKKFGRHLKKCSHEKVKSYLIAEIEKFEWGMDRQKVA